MPDVDSTRRKGPDITSCSYKEEHSIIWSSAGKYRAAGQHDGPHLQRRNILEVFENGLKKKKAGKETGSDPG